MIYFNIFAPKVLVHQIEPNAWFEHGVSTHYSEKEREKNNQFAAENVREFSTYLYFSI